MSNLSYCRFQNTVRDFRDCVENIRSLGPNDRHPNTDEERRARAEIVRLSAMLLEELGIDDPSDSHAVDGAVSEMDREPAVEYDDED